MSIWPFGIYRVYGESMLPEYRPGDTLLGLHWFRPRVGQVVVAVQAGRRIIKRVAAIQNGQIMLLGDNSAHATDSRNFGPISKNKLKAKIIAKL